MDLFKNDSDKLTASLFENSENGSTPLENVAMSGKIEKFEFLLDLVVDLNIPKENVDPNEENLHRNLTDYINDKFLMDWLIILYREPEMLKAFLYKTDNDGFTRFDKLVKCGLRENLGYILSFLDESNISSGDLIYQMLRTLHGESSHPLP